MVPRERLAAIEIATPLRDVLRIAATSPYSRLPVFRGTMGDVVGILHTKDVVTHFLQRGRTGSLASLVRPILPVADTMAADRLLGFLRERRSHQALVVDAGGAVVGMITLEDVLGELLGTVADEFKAPRLLPLRLTNGRVRLPGDLPLDQARVWVEGAWPSDGGTRRPISSCARPGICRRPARRSRSPGCRWRSRASRTAASPRRSSCRRSSRTRTTVDEEDES